MSLPLGPPVDIVLSPSGTALHTISRLLNTGLDPTTLAACAGLIEKGVDPEALAVSSCLLHLGELQSVALKADLVSACRSADTLDNHARVARRGGQARQSHVGPVRNVPHFDFISGSVNGCWRCLIWAPFPSFKEGDRAGSALTFSLSRWTTKATSSPVDDLAGLPPLAVQHAQTFHRKMSSS